jgi:hypothetical protein
MEVPHWNISFSLTMYLLRNEMHLVSFKGTVALILLKNSTMSDFGVTLNTTAFVTNPISADSRLDTIGNLESISDLLAVNDIFFFSGSTTRA